MTAELSSINPNTSLRGVVLSLPVKPIKAPVDAETLALKYSQDKFNEGFQRALAQRSRNYGHDDLGFEPPDFEPLREEIERLKCADYDLTEILETTTGVLLLLSRLPGTIFAMGPEAVEAVAKFSQAVREAQKS